MSSISKRDKWIPWYFVLFFAVIVLVDGIMVTIAVRTQTGVVTSHPYEKGLAYNQVVSAAGKQEALGWEGSITYRSTGTRKGSIQFVLTNSGKPLPVETATARFFRPTQAGMDFDVPLGDGKADILFPQAGLWEVRVYAKHNKTPYQQSKRLVVE